MQHTTRPMADPDPACASRPTASAATDAPGSPGMSPTWSSSDKDFVTTSLGASRLWATIGHGVVNEVFWPSTGRPRLRDLTFYLVGEHRWHDLKRIARYRLSQPTPTLPLLTVVHDGDDYVLTLEVLPDPERDVLLLRYGVEGPYELAIVAAPHLAEKGHCDAAWVEAGELFAGSGTDAICIASNVPLTQTSAGYVGTSDGWQDLSRHGRLTFAYDHAGPGNVALSAALASPQGVLAVAFGESAVGARTLARCSLAEAFDTVRDVFVAQWTAWRERSGLHAMLESAQVSERHDRGKKRGGRKGGDNVAVDTEVDIEKRLTDEALFSATVLKIHEDRTYPGAFVASLSVPWGNSSDSLGGYHLVWPRDATLAAFGLIAIGQIEDASRVLGHLQSAQTADGHWPQNYFPSGEPFWTGVQLDEAAFPVLLAAKLKSIGVEETVGVDSIGVRRMVHAAIGFVARTGPASDQDRWEENPGINPFSLAVAIAALVAAEPWLDGAERTYALDLADDWNARLESWCYVAGTRLAAEAGVAGYYVRIASTRAGPTGNDEVVLRNRSGERIAAASLVAMDFSYLSRLGLRAADDPRIVDTVKVVDHVLRVETPSGPLYHRYNDDGYGEHADGSPFDGDGIGRGWPLLVGERGHLALGLGEDCRPHLQTMLACAGTGGLIPEQVWDTAAIPERSLFPGRPSGSAMPLLWAHAEFLKLFVARRIGKPVERLDAVFERYAKGVLRPCCVRWRSQMALGDFVPDRPLLIEDTEPFTLHFGFDGWQQPSDRQAMVGAFGIWSVRFEPSTLAEHDCLDFTRRRSAGWEGIDHRIDLAAETKPPASVS